MNKKIKVAAATTLSIIAFSIFQPTKYSIMATKAYAEASAYALADKGELKSLDIQSTEGKSLDLCDDYDGYKVNLTDEKTYYVTLDKNSDGVKIYSESAGDDYVVKIFESDRKNATPHDIGENIPLKSGSNTLYIRTFTSESALKRAVKNQSINSSDKVYKININKTSVNGSNDICIEQMILESDLGRVPFSFNKDILSYDITVDEEAYELTIKVKPENEDYTVKIDGLKTTGDDDYKRSLPLKKGQNQIKINITDDADMTRTYTLNVNRGIAKDNLTNTSNSISTTINKNNQTPLMNQWVKVNNKWQYNDSVGSPLKNTWFRDKNSGKDYYMQSDGTMAVGWLNNNGRWYYLDSSGAMQTGWIKDSSGNYYYLQGNGAMATDSIINGFKVGSDGVWIR
ncbi:hypothetical protein GKZ28_04110 [Clostridium chromiireducens]|uniref:Cadherin-like beta-sandwich-like domain-containing protein n=1 Tax=Clostridium chromiireducens TaxID=225345 RepID=A0A964W1B5_9CLOT|nr:cadherin-like beta sandwich domain-containing protein [Clostridium chromiireducens]MVX62887.1 hypothetical protein [Clostridium chromiireducens]